MIMFESLQRLILCLVTFIFSRTTFLNSYIVPVVGAPFLSIDIMEEKINVDISKQQVSVRRYPEIVTG